MAYADYLRKLLAPLGVYDLGSQSVSGAMLDALGDALDEVWQCMQDNLREAFPQTAADLAQWERVLPLHGADPSPAVRRTAMLHRLQAAQISCSPEEIEQALAICGLDADLEMIGADTVRVAAPREGSADWLPLVRALVPAHLDIVWSTGT